MTYQESPQMLLIEDNPGDARYIREMLREAMEFSERTITRRNGLVQQDASTAEDDAALVHETRLDAGLERLDEDDLDVVLLDLNLPDSNGLDTLTTLVDRDDMVPVVVLTGLRDREVGVEALRQGAEEYLVKNEINPDLLIRSIFHAIERKAHEREQKRYETLIEESTDANAIVDPDGEIQYITPSAERVLGYAPEHLVGKNVLEFVHPEDRGDVRGEFEALLTDPDYRATAEFRFRHENGSWIVLHARGRNLLADSVIEGLVVYTHDVTERRERERQLEHQRQRLGALNQLNSVVHGVTEAVIDRSTRKEIEQTACDRLAESHSYEFAWVGEPDPRSETVTVRAESGVDGYLDDVTISTKSDETHTRPAGRALQTGEVQTQRNLHVDPQGGYEQDSASTQQFKSTAAIPIVHGETIYGVLNVYADRADAFRQEERSVIGHLGEIIGHAIAAAERKRALMSDSMVELDFRIRDVTDSLGVEETPDDTITLDRTIPVAQDEFLIYGAASQGEIETIEAMTEDVLTWEEVTILSEQRDEIRFELRVSNAPIMSEVASLGGSVERVLIRGTDLQMTVHLPQEVEVRKVIETIHDKYSQAEAVARRRVTREESPSERMHRVWAGELTDRQRTVVETAYFAGFFEWPRASNGEEVAESIGISAPTFSQHLRAAQNKVFGAVLGDDARDADDDGKSA